VDVELEVEVSHDRWRDQLRTARHDIDPVVALLRRGVPSDGLQLAGSAVLAATPSADLTGQLGELAASLRERGWRT
jgi:hypothetical protein